MQAAQPAPPAAEKQPVAYICGDCGSQNTLRPGDVIRCRDCGYRILYKKRTQRIVQYEARCAPRGLHCMPSAGRMRRAPTGQPWGPVMIHDNFSQRSTDLRES
jgi:DNA-directed RNA polymerase I, II, and III subunit RPABC4